MKKNRIGVSQINKIGNYKEVTMDITKIQSIMRDYCKQLYVNIMDSLKEIEQILRKVQSLKTEPGKNRKYEQSQVLKLKLLFKNSQKAKVQGRMTSEVNSRVNTYSSKTLLKNCKGRKTSKIILWSHHHPDTNIRQRYHVKKKLQANINDEHRLKNPRQNTSKLNPTIY